VFPRDPNEPRVIIWLRNPSVRRTLILSALWLFAFAVLFSFRAVLLPFGIAVLIAFIIEPVVERTSRLRLRGRRVPRVAAVLSIYAASFVALYVFLSFTIPQIGHEFAKFPTQLRQVIVEAQAKANHALEQVEEFARANNLPFERSKLDVDQYLRENPDAVVENLSANAAQLLSFGRDLVATVVGTVFGLFLVLMLTAFLSMDRERIEQFATSLVPPEYVSSYDTIVRGISNGLAGVVRGQVLICLTNGVLTFIGLWLLGVKLPIILATVATVFSLIPIFGSIISTIPIVAIALTDSFTLGILTLLWIIGIHLVEANLLNPKIMGDAAKIHPVIVVFVLIVGEKTSGLIGALFAVPIAAVVLTIFKFLHNRALTASNEPPEPAPSA